VIIAEHKGRLGNQLFQWAGVLKLAKPQEPILLLGYEDLQRFLRTPERVRFLHSNRLGWYRLATRLLTWAYRLPPLLRRRLFLTLEEDISTGRIERVGARRTLLPLTLVRHTFFLGDPLLEFSAFQRDQIQPIWQQRAQQWFAARGLQAEHCCFVHVRRGDYCHYPDPAQPGVLPKRYFQEMIERQKAAGFHHVVVASDDWPWVLDALPELPAEGLLAEGVELTLAVMACCGAGILSPSTYAWAAALLAGSAEASERFVAPLHWVGFRSGQWYPYASIASRSLSYVAWQPEASEQLPPR
jgi:hypothetical protein